MIVDSHNVMLITDATQLCSVIFFWSLTDPSLLPLVHCLMNDWFLFIYHVKNSMVIIICFLIERFLG